MTFKERIELGLKGQYKGLSNGLKRVNKYIFGVQRGCYTLIGGMSGSAKTTLLDFILISAIADAISKNIVINIIYYSFEIDEFTKKANWLSMLIYSKYKRIITPETIKGLGEFRLTEEEQQLIDLEIIELDKIWSKITWRFQSMNPTGMYKEWWDHMKSRGTFVKSPYIDENGVNQERIDKFILIDPNEYNIVAGDHVALCKLERNFTLKENLDKLSAYTVIARNLFQMTFFWLQQFNQGLNSVDRQKFKGIDISPQQGDYKDSTNPYTDADVVLGLLNAHKMDMETCLGYNINNGEDKPYNLKDRFRMLKIVKNRLSRDNIALGLIFKAESGSFIELPPANELKQPQFDEINRLIKR